MLNSIQFYQYKNASFFGSISKFSIQKQQKTTQLAYLYQSSHHTLINPFLSHFVQTNNPSKQYRQVYEGTGLVIDDEGHLLLGEWKDNKIDGNYLLYKPNLIEQLNCQRFYNGICQYGHMKDDELQGQNYLHHYSGDIIKAQFKSNQIIGRCCIYNNKSNSDRETEINQDMYQCQFIDMDQNKSGFNNGDYKEEKIQGITQQLKDARQILGPVQFLHQFIDNHQLNHQSKGLSSIKISENQYFFGFLKGQKLNRRQQALNHANQIFSGLGVIFYRGWPIKYGQFEKGKLQGLGRLYQTQMNILDGIFHKQKILQGFLLDHFNDQMHFGKQLQQYDGKDSKFSIEQSFRCQQIEHLLDFKRQYHLKSLNFKNGYFQMPKMIKLSPWPLKIINKLYRNNTMNNIIKSFSNPIKEHPYCSDQPQHKSKDLKLQQQIISQTKRNKNAQTYNGDNFGLTVNNNEQISFDLLKHLKHKFKNNQHHRFNSYVRQYQKIQSKLNIMSNKSASKDKIIKTQAKNIEKTHNQLKSINTRRDKLPKNDLHLFNLPYKEQKKPIITESHINNSRLSHQKEDIVKKQDSQIQRSDLQQLIEQYKQFSKVSNNGQIYHDYPKIQSKHQLMKLDHQLYYPLLKKDKKKQNINQTYRNKITVMPLDKIYRQHFNH